MAEEPNASKDLTTAAISVVERIGQFFHLFDMSFFVSGVVAFSAGVFMYFQLGQTFRFPFSEWMGAVAVIVACYVCGLLSFAAGRGLNGRLFRRRKLPRKFNEAIGAHHLGTNPIVERYQGNERRLYIRMWSELAHTRPRSVAFNLMQRYWVMSATYDGLGAALSAWAIVFGLSGCSWVVPHAMRPWSAVSVAIVCLALATLALIQGAKYYEYQIEEIIAEISISNQ